MPRKLGISLRDPDAPRGTYTHWLVAGIDPASSDVAQGMIPAGGREEIDIFGERSYGARVRHPETSRIAMSPPSRLSTHLEWSWCQQSSRRRGR
jgi:phosphatidylethanolamine-binding protein (PEBP) family uncharacterized protein